MRNYNVFIIYLYILNYDNKYNRKDKYIIFIFFQIMINQDFYDFMNKKIYYNNLSYYIYYIYYYIMGLLYRLLLYIIDYYIIILL